MKQISVFILVISFVLSITGCIGFSDQAAPQNQASTNPAESTVTYATVESIDASESAEATEATEATEPAETTEPTEATELTEPTEPTEATKPTEATEPTEVTEPIETTKPSEDNYPYDFGTRIDNPTDYDIQMFYDMVKTIFYESGKSNGWDTIPSFTSQTADYDLLMSLVMNQVGEGMFFQYNFHFETERILLDYMGEVARSQKYHASDVDWVLKAVFGRTAIHHNKTESSYSYYEGDYYYRIAVESMIGSLDYSLKSFEPTYEITGNREYHFHINMCMYDYMLGSTVDGVYEFVAVPMRSADFGTYWKIISFANHTQS